MQPIIGFCDVEGAIRLDGWLCCDVRMNGNLRGDEVIVRSEGWQLVQRTEKNVFVIGDGCGARARCVGEMPGRGGIQGRGARGVTIDKDFGRLRTGGGHSIVEKI